MQLPQVGEVQSASYLYCKQQKSSSVGMCSTKGSQTTWVTGDHVSHDTLEHVRSQPDPPGTTLCCVSRVMQSREARIGNAEDVAKYGLLLLKNYKLPEDECECDLMPPAHLSCCAMQCAMHT